MRSPLGECRVVENSEGHRLENNKRVNTASTYAIVRRVMLEQGSKHVGSYLIVLIFMIIVASCTSLSAWLMKHLVDATMTENATTSPMYYPLLVSGLFIVKGTFSYFQDISVTRIGGRIVNSMQTELYDHLLRMDVAFFHRQSSSDLITRMTNGANAVREVINLIAVTLGRDLLTVLGLCGVMIAQDPLLFLIVLATAPVAGLVLRQLSMAAKDATKSETKGMTEILSLTRETVQGIRMLKAFQLEDVLAKRMKSATAATEHRRNQLARIKASVAPISEILSGIAIGAVVLYATLRSQANPGSIGSFFSFIAALLLAGEPLRRLSRLQIDLTTASERVAMFYDILDRTQMEPTKDDRPALTVTGGDINFKKVTFGYPGSQKNIFSDFSIAFPGGKFTAIVGMSGGGKTTLLSLIQGFFEPRSGSIEIDGVSIDDVSRKSLRSQISYLDQDAFLFEGSIEDNIVGAIENRDPERVVAAAKAANADQFIEALKRGYDTKLRELASNLSGGQKQRIAIARAFYKNAPILLLDEPTSALDSEAELQVRRAISSLAAGKTTVMVAHRLSTVRGADLIHVISEGRVVESGTHDELVGRRGVYARLLDGQTHAGHKKRTAEVA